MPRSTSLKLLVVAAALGFCAACSNTTPTTATTTPTTSTETFSGNLNPNGAQTFSFNVAAAGTMTATLTTLSPDSALPVGLALGTWNTSTLACQIVIANDKLTQGQAVLGSASAAGTLCVRVYDVGNLTAVESFVITVVHP